VADDLDLDFGAKLDQQDQNYMVGAASVFEGILAKAFQ
jgi:hypothetical protein